MEDIPPVARAGRPPVPDDDATVIRAAAPAVDPDATVLRPPGAAVPRPAASPDAPRRTLAPLALPRGHRLHEYRIDEVLGQGGFGITYLATDVNLHAQVAIKEYLPAQLAVRAG